MAYAEYEVAFSGPGSWNAIWTINYSRGISEECVALVGSGALRRSVVILPANGANSVAASAITNGDLAITDGLVFDKQLDGWVATVPLSGGAGSKTFVAACFSFDDQSLDVNGDGRFNSHDVDALDALIGLSDADYMNWDFNGSGDPDNDIGHIDQFDVDILQALIDAGLGSGVLGDLDGDGFACCNDTVGTDFDDYFGFVLGDANYIVALDADLDGDTDEFDRNEAWFAACPGDFNRDETLSAADFSAFAAAYAASDLRADYNRDGFLGTADFSAFGAAYFASVNCPH